MRRNELPRLILTPWGYITPGLALLNYRAGKQHPDQTVVYDNKTRRYRSIDWTEPGVIAHYLGIDDTDPGGKGSRQ